MRRLLCTAGLAVLCLGVTALATPAGAQEAAASVAGDAELEAAIFARHESLEFLQRLDELRQAQEAEQEAIDAIAEVRAIDAELKRLYLGIRELLARRREIVNLNATRFGSYRRDVEAAQENLRLADPVQQLAIERREDPSTGVEEDGATVVALATP